MLRSCKDDGDNDVGDGGGGVDDCIGIELGTLDDDNGGGGDDEEVDVVVAVGVETLVVDVDGESKLANEATFTSPSNFCQNMNKMNTIKQLFIIFLLLYLFSSDLIWREATIEHIEQ